MQFHLTDQVPSAADFDRDETEYEAETNMCETKAGIDEIENGQLLPLPGPIIA